MIDVSYKYFFIILIFYCQHAWCQQGELTDIRDGRIYKTIVIGSQTWMAENLAYARQISHIETLFLDSMNIYYYKDDTANYKRYGLLYRWDAAQRACPAGWRLPSKQDYEILLNNYKNGKDAYAALRKSGSSGFDGLIGGWVSSHGHIGLGAAGFFWTSSAKNKKMKWCFIMSRKTLLYNRVAHLGAIEYDHCNSVRCIKE